MQTLSVFGLLVLSTCAVAALADENGEKIEVQVFKERSAYRTGEVTLEVLSRNGRNQQKINYQVVFDGDQRRMRKQVISGDKLVDSRIAIAKHKEFILWDDSRSASGTGLAVVIDHIKTNVQRKDVFDPRLFGALPVAVSELAYHSLSKPRFLAPTARNYSVSNEPVGKVETLKLEISTDKSLSGTFWIAPSMGYLLVRAEVTDTGVADRPVRDVFESQIAKVSDGNLWYPRTTKLTRYYGDEVIAEESTTVTSARFNASIDPNTFALATMDIPPGTGVIEHPRNPTGSRMWNGTELVPIGGNGKQAIPPAAPNSTRSYLFIAANCAVIALLIGVAMFRGLFRATADA